MGKIYTILIYLMIIPILVCIKNIKKFHNDISSSITRCLVFAIFTILGNGLFTLNINETISYLAMALYLFAYDLMLIYILQYSQQYTNVFSEVRPFRSGCFILAFADGISLFLNAFYHQVFTLKLTTYGNLLIYHIDKRYAAYYLHYIFAYFIVLMFIASLIVKIAEIPHFYRKKYYPIISVMSVIIILNLIYTISGFPIDLSLPFFLLAAFLICYFTFYHTPNELIDKTLSIVVTEINNSVICFDIDSKCVYANDSARRLFNLDSDDGSTENISKYAQRLLEENILDNKDYFTWSEKRMLGDDEHHFDAEFRKLYDSHKNYIGFFISLIDVTEKYIAYNKERYLATHDRLTGIYNSSYFSEKVSELLKRDPDTPRLILCSNIKDFKLVNDLFGLEKGNEVLKMLAELLKTTCCNGTLYGRTGGDKFAVCIPKEHFKEEDFLNAIYTLSKTFNNTLYHLHIYVGVYEITDCNEDVSIMCDKANIAIKTLHETYDKCIAYYNDSIFNDTLLEKRLVGEFDTALAEKQFCMYLQPQMTPEGQMLGAEALVRWQHPNRGLIFPGDFINVFERTGLIYRLDKYVWELAVQKLSEWQKHGKNELYISINISAKDFYYMDVYKTITTLVEKYGIIPKTLKLEITETAIMTGISGELEILEQFRNYGFQVEIDDFGSGYSSLNTLKDMDVDVLKIDMGFLRTTKPDRIKRSMSILNNIIDLSKTLGLSVITEGVETKEQVTALTKMGCRIYQGYYFSKPIPIEDFENTYLK